MEKTNSIAQRADIANAIIIPKLLYIAQHAWPTIAIVREAEMRLKNFLWHSSFALPQGRVKGWINAEALELPRNEGGLSIPNIGVELHALSAQTVGAWALESSRIVRVVGDILRSRDGVKWPLITPVWRGQAPVNIRSSMWINGSNWVARSLAPIFSEAIISNQIMLLAKCRRRHGVTARWISGELVCDFRSILDAVQSSARSLDEGFGRFSAESVLQLQIRDIPLYNSLRQPENICKRFSLLAPAASRIIDALEWKWVRPGIVKWKCTNLEYPMASRLAHQIRDLALVLSVVFPGILLKQTHYNEVIVTHKLADPHHEFSLSAGPGAAVFHSWGNVEPTIFVHTTPPLLDHEIATFLGAPAHTVWTAPHVRVARLAAIWAGKRRWKQTRVRYKREIAEKRISRGKQRIKHAIASWARESGVITSALERLQWKSLSRIPGISTYQHVLLYRLKLHALTLWDPTLKKQACPHAECINEDNISHTHVFWDCPFAQRRWNITRGLFARLDTDLYAPNTTEIFSLTLNYPPGKCLLLGSEWREQNPGTKEAMNSDEINAVVNKYWSFAVAETLSSIWRARVDMIYNTSSPRSGTNDRDALFWAQLQTGFDVVASTFALDLESAEEWAIAMNMRKHLREERPGGPDAQLRSPPQTAQFVGFFDGGSRGNPGPGGCGSVLVQIDEGGMPRIIWISSISMQKVTCTNNFAEFNGLLRLLHYIDKGKLKQVHIVGDSQLILRMMRDRRRPKAKTLQRLYDTARALADTVRIASWRHHYRLHNKMADHLANLAMDSRRSQQDEPKENDQMEQRYPGVLQFLMNDFTKWADTNAGPDILMPSPQH